MMIITTINCPLIIMKKKFTSVPSLDVLKCVYLYKNILVTCINNYDQYCRKYNTDFSKSSVRLIPVYNEKYFESSTIAGHILEDKPG